MDLLTQKNIKPTQFREAVLSIFIENDYAISLQDIEEKLIKFDRVTLYRTIKKFKENGLIHEIALPEEILKYALCELSCSDIHHKHNHIHFKCNKCLEISCQEVDFIPKIKINDFEIDELEIMAKGTCYNCKTKSKKA